MTMTDIDKLLNSDKFKNLGITKASEAAKYEFYSTPFASVIGGLPIGRFTTIAGPEHR